VPPGQRQGVFGDLLGIGRPPCGEKLLTRTPCCRQIRQVARGGRRHPLPLDECRQRARLIDLSPARLDRHLKLRRGTWRRRSQFFAQVALVPDIGRYRARSGAESRRQYQHQRALQIAFKQEAAFVQARKKHRTRTVPLGVAGMTLDGIPDAAGLCREF
jgi:hypothetical protein